MTVSLHPERALEKRQERRIRRSDPFAHEDAMALCLARDAKVIAKRLGLSGRREKAG